MAIGLAQRGRACQYHKVYRRSEKGTGREDECVEVGGKNFLMEKEATNAGKNSRILGDV